MHSKQIRFEWFCSMHKREMNERTPCCARKAIKRSNMELQPMSLCLLLEETFVAVVVASVLFNLLDLSISLLLLTLLLIKPGRIVLSSRERFWFSTAAIISLFIAPSSSAPKLSEMRVSFSTAVLCCNSIKGTSGPQNEEVSLFSKLNRDEFWSILYSFVLVCLSFL